jgi:hypothetical protein
MIAWGEAEIRVDADGLAVQLVRGEHLVVELGWVGATGAEASMIADDEIEHTLATPVGRLLQRQAVNDGWRSRWVLVREAGGHVPVVERIRVSPGPEYALWSWGSGVTAMLAVCPAHSSGPVLGLRLEQGYLAPAGRPVLGAASAEYVVAPDDAVLGNGERLVTVLAAQWYPTLGAFETRLPGWVAETQLDDGVTWWGDVADFGISVPEGVELGYQGGAVSVDGPIGLQTIQVHTPRGLSRLDLEWVPQLEAVLHPLAAGVLRAGGQPSIAEALCLQFASDRKAVWLDPLAQDLLDQVDWEADGSLMAAAFALARGRSLGEAALVSDGLRLLARLPAGVGFGRVVMAGFLASLGVGLDAHDRCLELLGRPAVGRTASLESSLLHYRSADFGQAELAGVANRLGGLLPGEAPLLDWTELAQLVGLLDLCPPEWPEANHYAQVASKARGHLLCAYVDGRITSAEPLAWLLLSPELSPAL